MWKGVLQLKTKKAIKVNSLMVVIAAHLPVHSCTSQKTAKTNYVLFGQVMQTKLANKTYESIQQAGLNTQNTKDLKLLSSFWSYEAYQAVSGGEFGGRGGGFVFGANIYSAK